MHGHSTMPSLIRRYQRTRVRRLQVTLKPYIEALSQVRKQDLEVS